MGTCPRLGDLGVWVFFGELDVIRGGMAVLVAFGQGWRRSFKGGRVFDEAAESGSLVFSLALLSRKASNLRSSSSDFLVEGGVSAVAAVDGH